MTAAQQALEHLQAALQALGAPAPESEVDRAARAILEAVLRLAGSLAVPEHLKREPVLQYLTEQQLAERLGCASRKLRELRLSGGGPCFIHLGRQALYSTKSVLEWEAQLPIEHTSADFGREQRKGVK